MVLTTRWLPSRQWVAMAEHRVLRTAAAVLTSLRPEQLVAFGELLQAHVRFDERELFKVAQQRLAPAALAGLRG